MNTKRKKILVIITSISLIMFFACTQKTIKLQEPIQDKSTGKWGYVDSIGKVAVRFIYEEADNFNYGLAKVKLNGKYGYIDNSGKEVIPCIYEEAYAFKDSLAKVKLNNKCGFIDTAGKERIQLIYDELGDMSEGIIKANLNGKYGYIDKTGMEIIPLKYEEAGEFKDDWLKVKLNGKYGYVDKTGKTVVPFIYDSSADLSFVNAISFKGGSCEYYPEGKGSWIASGNTYILNLKFTLEKNTNENAISDVYNKGRVVSPDGKSYEAGTVLSKDNVYDLWFSIPSSVDREKLIFVYNNQVLLLKK